MLGLIKIKNCLYLTMSGLKKFKKEKKENKSKKRRGVLYA